MTLPVFEVFRQKAPGEAHVHVGEVEAPDSATAMILAKEHFARREVCCSLWVVDRADVVAQPLGPRGAGGWPGQAYRRSGGIRASAEGPS